MQCRLAPSQDMQQRLTLTPHLTLVLSMHDDVHRSEGAEGADVHSAAAGDCSLHLKPRFHGVRWICAEQRIAMSRGRPRHMHGRNCQFSSGAGSSFGCSRVKTREARAAAAPAARPCHTGGCCACVIHAATDRCALSPCQMLRSHTSSDAKDSDSSSADLSRRSI